jgi:hypothetical protein
MKYTVCFSIAGAVLPVGGAVALRLDRIVFSETPSRPPLERDRKMPEVAIIGAVPHPFGRFSGKLAIKMGADAVRLALRDAGVEWRDILAENGSQLYGAPGMAGVSIVSL